MLDFRGRVFLLKVKSYRLKAERLQAEIRKLEKKPEVTLANKP